MIKDRRSYYRIYYPEGYCPHFRMNKVNFKVFDLSEWGMRFRTSPETKIHFTDAIIGTLNFENGESFLLRGTISRLTDHDVTITLKTPVPLRKIVAEQRELITRYPQLKTS